VPFHLYHFYFLAALPEMAASALTHTGNQSITAALARLTLLPVSTWSTYTVVHIPQYVRVINGLMLAVFIGLICYRAATHADRLVLLLTAMACEPLITPQGWAHTFAFAILLIAYLAVFGRDPVTRVISIVTWLILLIPGSYVFKYLLSITTTIYDNFRFTAALMFVLFTHG
jgi:hypothetical protein